MNLFVDTLADVKLELLTEHCSRWRNNSVYQILKAHPVWKEKQVPVDFIDVRQAEEQLAYIVERHAFRVMGIVEDSELWTKRPYNNWDMDASVQYPIVMGIFKSGRWKLFDGIHQAIFLASKGEMAVTVCFCDA